MNCRARCPKCLSTLGICTRQNCKKGALHHCIYCGHEWHTNDPISFMDGEGTLRARSGALSKYRIIKPCHVCGHRCKRKNAILVYWKEQGIEAGRRYYCSSACFDLDLPNLKEVDWQANRPVLDPSKTGDL